MKKTILVLTCCVAVAWSCAAQGQKIATIDLRKVFDGYWRTKTADVNLKEQASDLEKERTSMVEQFQKAEEKYKKLLDSANDQALSTAERDKRKKEAENELLGLRDFEGRIKQFDNTSRTQLAERRRRMRDNILQEIRDAVKAKVKSSGYTLVVDSAAETVNETPVVIYNAGTDDITEAVLGQLNINAPPPSANETKPDKDAKPAKPGK